MALEQPHVAMLPSVPESFWMPYQPPPNMAGYNTKQNE